MKIAVIAPTEIPARRANTFQVMKMAQALAELGHAVKLTAPSPQSGSEQGSDALRSWENLARHYGLKHRFDVEWVYANPRLKRYDYSWRAVRHARRWQADLIYTRLPQAAALSSRLGLPALLEIHDLPQGRIGPWLFRQFLCGRGSKRLVVITQALAADLERMHHLQLCPPLTVIAPDGVDLERYQDLPLPPSARQALASLAPNAPLARLKPERSCAGYTGHLYRGRGGLLLVELAKLLPQVDFLIVGGEPEHVQRLQVLAEQASLDNLILTGFVPNADLPLYQAACDILLMPYQQHVEASSGGDIARYLSPMKLFEYLACERAIVCSALPVLQEVLNPGNSVLVPTEEPAAWAAAVLGLLQDPEQRAALAKRARQDAQLYTWGSRAQKILDGLENDPRRNYKNVR
jgi:glycosyltransferase involved in cell wall biosynthesis